MADQTTREERAVTDTTKGLSGDISGGGVSRRLALRGGVVAGVGVPLLAACGGSDDGDTGGSGADANGDGGDAGSSEGAGGGAFATTSEIPEGGGAIFEDQGIVVTQPEAGEFKGFTNICTHRQCPLSSVSADAGTIDCNCHGSKYSITDGSVVNGPATEGLAEKAITVDGDSISLA
jgi:nitrite reductase/ring-hydroxylating ferredoxin subunit